MRTPKNQLTQYNLTWPRFIFSIVITIVAMIIVSFGLIPIAKVVREIEFDSLDTLETFSLFAQFVLVGLMHLGTASGVWLAFERSYLDLINPTKAAIRSDIFWAIIVSVLTFILQVISNLFFPELSSVSFVFKPEIWFTWILPFLLIILIQVAAEEILIRGYLQPYLCGLGLKPFFYIGIPALIFTALHYWNFTEANLRIPALFQIFCIAILWGDWADRTGSLAGTITMHFLNNAMLMLFVGSSLEPATTQIWRENLNSAHYDQLTYAVGFIYTTLLLLYFGFIRSRLPDRRNQGQ